MSLVDPFHVRDLPFIANISAEEFPVALSCLVVGVCIRASWSREHHRHSGPDTSEEWSSQGVLLSLDTCLKIPSCLIWRSSSHTCVITTDLWRFCPFHILILCSVRGRLSLIWDGLWSAYDVVMKCLWSAYEVVMKCLWSAHEVLMRCLWSACEVLMRSLWSAYEVLMRSLWSAYAVLIKWLWGIYEVLMKCLSYEVLMRCL